MDRPENTFESNGLAKDLTTFLHASCPRCHHWHNAVKMSVNLETHTNIMCHHCGLKMFGIGRSSTHSSLISQETSQSWSKPGSRRNTFRCYNVVESRNTSPRSSQHVSSPRTPHAPSQPYTELAPHDDALGSVAQHGQPTGDNAEVEGERRSVFGSFLRKSLRRLQGRRRGRILLNSGVRRLGKLFGYEVHISKTGRPYSATSGKIDPSLRGRADHTHTLRPPSEHRRIPTSSINHRNAVNEPPNAQRNTGDTRSHNGGPTSPSMTEKGAKEHIRAIRRQMTKDALAARTCQCDENCFCNRGEWSNVATEGSDHRPINGEHSSARSSMSSLRPSVILAHIGSSARIIAGSRNSHASNSSIHRRHSLSSSRPSRLSINTSTTNTSSNGRRSPSHFLSRTPTQDEMSLSPSTRPVFSSRRAMSSYSNLPLSTVPSEDRDSEHTTGMQLSRIVPHLAESDAGLQADFRESALGHSPPDSSRPS